MKQQKNFSKSFKILLNPTPTDIDSSMIDVSHTKNGNDRTQQLRQYLNNVIQSETEETEARIQRYSTAQMAALREFRQKSEHDYRDILR